MSQDIKITQCEVIINEGIINIVNMGRILNEIKSSKNYEYEYKEIEKLFLKNGESKVQNLIQSLRFLKK